MVENIGYYKTTHQGTYGMLRISMG
ncbi:uncharacterized protein G2W53_010704 [Senna tora]|uniref:Uncharacterized protein n=1 Tax=Senna tora TaxID=362788 RepID=A0A835CBY3_9FABA|nr:uncharacterized protein G2W53_010704 [Senna tora]